MSQNGVQILPAQLRDVPVLANISAAAFETDSQTEMKSHGKAPFDMRKYALQAIPIELRNPRIRILKAVDGETGEIMGFCTWGFRGIEPPTFPAPEGADADDSGVGDGTPERAEVKGDTDEKEGGEPDDPIARLERLTSGDLKRWMDDVMPEDGKDVTCLFVIGLSVSPAFQRCGVGSALLRWGTDMVDGRDGAFAWVHSSAGAWRAYERARFRTVRILDVDLDAYAPVPAPAERYEGGKWGRYVFRYMVYGTPPHIPS